MKIIGANDDYQTSSEIGGKAKGLLSLHQNGFRVPAFFLMDFETIAAVQKQIVSLNSILSDWMAESNIREDQLWAVRSSAAVEDGKVKSFAGQFETVLNVPFDKICESIKKVINSYAINTEYSEESTKYGVIIQEMLSPSFSGVLFSRDPIKPYSDDPVVNIIPGLGEKLVSGEFSGLHIGFTNVEPLFLNLNEKIIGERFDGNKKVSVSCTVKDIKEALEPHLDLILRSMAQLEKIKKTALDFEFAIHNGQFYWLQVRPITTRSLCPKYLIWDNTSVEANYPGITLPLTISFIQRTFFKAYTGAGKSLGFNKRVLEKNHYLLNNMCGEIDGALYYNVTAWQSLLYLMPFGIKLSAKLPKLWGMEEAPFYPPSHSHSIFDKFKISYKLILKLLRGPSLERSYLRLHNSTMDSFNSLDLSSDSFDNLVKRYGKIEKELGNNWIAPALNGFYTMIVFTLLNKKVEKSKIYKTHPNFVNDILFSDGDMISVKLVRDFQKILSEISLNKELNQLFVDCSEKDILARMPKEFSSFNVHVINYIESYGNRTDQGELKMETITYKQNPELFVRYIKSNLKGFVVQKKNDSSFNYKQVLKQHFPVNFIKRWFYQRLIQSAVKRIKMRENYRFMRTDTFAVIRKIFLQMGEVLYKEEKIEVTRDVLYLKLVELMDLNKQDSFKELIRVRKLRYEVSANAIRYNRYIDSEGQLIPINSEEIQLEESQLKGTGCCSGVVKSKVVLVDPEMDFNQDFSDCILISNYFEPGWISLFYQAKGVVSERGNLLSHTAIICRELNVPSIVGVKGLTKIIKNGDFIEMDGATGIIKRLAND